MWLRLDELHRCLWTGCLPLEAVHAAAVKAMLCCGHFTAARKQLAGEALSPPKARATYHAAQRLCTVCMVCVSGSPLLSAGTVFAFCWDCHVRLSAIRPSACCCADTLQTECLTANHSLSLQQPTSTCWVPTDQPFAVLMHAAEMHCPML